MRFVWDANDFNGKQLIEMFYTFFIKKRTPSLSHTCSENNAVFLNPFFLNEKQHFCIEQSIMFFLFFFSSVEIFCSHLKIRFTSTIHKNMFNRPKTRIRCNFDFFLIVFFFNGNWIFSVEFSTVYNLQKNQRQVFNHTEFKRNIANSKIQNKIKSTKR